MPLARLLQFALLPFSLLYDAASRVDRRRKLRRRFRSSLRVISVGNISVGGTGKSQLVEMLVRELVKTTPVLILSRGYGRQSSDDIVWNVDDALPDAELLGDEPAALARVLAALARGDVGERASSATRSAIAVGRDRASLLQSIEGSYTGAIAILDDGFQHLRLARDVDIVVVDTATASRPHLLIPAGRLREGPGALARADVAIATSAAARAFTERYLNSGSIFDARVVVTALRGASDGEVLDPLGLNVVLVTGIAQPHRVVSSLNEIGAVVVNHLSYRDHHRYSSKDVDDILEAHRSSSGSLIATTTKDAVKLEPFADLAAHLAVLETRLIVDDEERFLRTVHPSNEKPNTY